jgi:hypothetical protein
MSPGNPREERVSGSSRGRLDRQFSLFRDRATSSTSDLVDQSVLIGLLHDKAGVFRTLDTQ